MSTRVHNEEFPDLLEEFPDLLEEFSNLLDRVFLPTKTIFSYLLSFPTC